MTDDLHISSYFSMIIKRWWLLIGLMIVGGVAGFLCSFIRQPLYESQAVVTSILDYAVLGRLDDGEQDEIYRSIGDVINSSKVRKQVIMVAETNGIQITSKEEEYFTADRQDTRWVIRVRAKTPELAQQLNTYWATAAMDALNELSENNQIAFTYHRYLASLTDCFEQSVTIDPVSQECSVGNITEIREAMAITSAKTGNLEYRDSLILSHVSSELTSEPSLPNSPIIFSKNILVLAGAMIGLLVALIFINTNLSSKKQD